MPGTKGRRESYKLTNTNNKLNLNKNWKPRSLTVNNTSGWPCYVVVGGSGAPSAVSFSDVVPPFTAYVLDPAGAQDFSFFVDNTAAPGVPFTYPINIVLSSGAASAQGPLNSNFATGYIAKVLNIQKAKLICAWPLNELAGTVAVNPINASRSGVYDGPPTLGTTLFKDGVNLTPTFVTAHGDNVNVLTAGGGVGFKDVFSGAAVSVLFWTQTTLAHLNDANTGLPVDFHVDASNFVQIIKNSGGNHNQITWQYGAGGSFGQIALNGFVDTGWNAWGITGIQGPGGRMRAFKNGVQQGVDQAVAAAFVGALTVAKLMSSMPDQGAMCFVWTTELTPAEMLAASTAT